MSVNRLAAHRVATNFQLVQNTIFAKRNKTRSVRPIGETLSPK